MSCETHGVENCPYCVPGPAGYQWKDFEKSEPIIKPLKGKKISEIIQTASTKWDINRNPKFLKNIYRAIAEEAQRNAVGQVAFKLIEIQANKDSTELEWYIAGLKAYSEGKE